MYSFDIFARENCPDKTVHAKISENVHLYSKEIVNINELFFHRLCTCFVYFYADTVPYVNQTDYDALVPDNTPIGGSCINYHVTDDDIGDVDLLQHSFVDATGLFELNTTFPGRFARLNCASIINIFIMYHLTPKIARASDKF